MDANKKKKQTNCVYGTTNFQVGTDKAPGHNTLNIPKRTTHHVMILPRMVSSKLNQKLSILDVKFFIQMHDENCPSILYEHMNVHMSLI